MLPIRYRTIDDAMGMCEALGERGDFLKPFENYDEWEKFSNMYMENPAIEKYCDHGGRYMLWLPYQVVIVKCNLASLGVRLSQFVTNIF